MILYVLIYLVIIVGVVGAVISKKLLNSAIMLAIASIGISLLLFGYSAPWAAVFELSVCAGLITVLFISAVSLVKNEEDTTKEKQIKYSIFPLIMSAVVILSSIFIPEYFEKLSSYANTTQNGNELKIGDIIWSIRGIDVIAQIMLLAGGVFAIKHIFSYVKKQEE
ncbi:MAG: NADH-quinone oxidoreductase subunit J [Clostridia bacterium]|nr:NADH-quinone oxidoreductase subunit J [Clostridia bacterium]